MPQTGDNIFSDFLLSAQLLYKFFFSLPNTKNTKKKKKKKKPKITSKLLDSSLFTKKHKVLAFRGVDVAFLAIIHIPNLLNIFLAFILLFLLE